MRITARNVRQSRAIAAAMLGVLLMTPRVGAGAQALGPFRQLLAIEPYFTSLNLDNGAPQRQTLNGYGGRLWVNLEPFHAPGHTSMSLFFSRATKPDLSMTQYGGSLDLFLLHRPLGQLIDPFVSAGAGALRTHTASAGTDTRFALSPGGGIRIPMPNRFELRGDVRDAIVFERRIISAAGSSSGGATHNLELTAGLGVTF